MVSGSKLISFITMFSLFLSEAAVSADDATTQPASQPSTQPTLKVGDSPPPLTVKRWIKGEPITRFEPGKIYLVTFGATWCGPCISAIRDLAWLQEKYAKDDVIVIGVDGSEAKSDESELAPFLKQHGNRITYRFAIDESPGEYKKGPLFTAWMKASGASGIPTTFVIGRDGRLAAIGHPASINGELSKIIAGTYDPAADARAEAAVERLLPAYNEAAKAKDTARLLELIDQIIAAAPHLTKFWQVHRTQLLAQRGRADEAERILDEVEREANEGPPGFRLRIAYARVQLAVTRGDSAAMNRAVEATAAMTPDSADDLNVLAWSIVGGGPDDPKRKLADLALVQRIAEQANALAEGQDANLLDTLARVYALRGDFARAVDTQTKALALTPADDAQRRKDLSSTLDRYRTRTVDAPSSGNE